MQEQLNSIETKIMDLHILLNTFMVKQEKRLTRLETIQKGFLWAVGLSLTGLSTFLLMLKFPSG